MGINLGRLGEKQVCYLCAMLPPTIYVFVSATPRSSMLDSFFALKSGVDLGKASASTTSQMTSMTFKDGVFSIELDIQVSRDLVSLV